MRGPAVSSLDLAAVAWVTPDPARLHYTLAYGDIISKSDSATYLAGLFPQWADLAARTPPSPLPLRRTQAHTSSRSLCAQFVGPHGCCFECRIKDVARATSLMRHSNDYPVGGTGYPQAQPSSTTAVAAGYPQLAGAG